LYTRQRQKGTRSPFFFFVLLKSRKGQGRKEEETRRKRREKKEDLLKIGREREAKLQIIEKKLTEIKPYKKNPRKNDAAVPYVAESIREFGFKVPLVIDKDGEIVAGHTRYKAAQQLGLETVPCIIADDLTPKQIKAFRLADNKVAEKAEWDDGLLDLELADLTDLDMNTFGFDLPEKEKPAEPEEDDYDADMARPEARTKKGDIYLLGEHRLMCGDSTDAGDVAELMGGRLADLVLTDPPYNVAIGSKNKALNEMFKQNGKKCGSIEIDIAGDKGMTDEEIGQKLWLPAFTNARANSADTCSVYITMPQGGTHMMMMMMMKEAGWQVKHELIWAKNAATFSMGRLDYDYQHEPILYGWNRAHEFYSNDYEKSIIEDIPEDIDALTEKAAKRLLKRLMDDRRTTSVIRENKPQKSELHPTMKPVKLFGRLIKNSSKPGQIVLDLFGGSGTTIIACEQLDRVCMMMECDPHYCDVIIDRWEQYTGDKAEKIKEGKGG
jgi:site-specific DNA-methyltransferase (adenine-specific)